MILEALEKLHFPIIWVMDKILQLFWSLTGSAGTSIILLSCFIALVSYPLRRWASKIEARVRDKKHIVDELVSSRAKNLKGESRFRIIEEVYTENKFHPVQSIALGISFLVMLPFLLSALFLLSDNPDLVDVPYIIIPDLSKPDGLAAGLNILPLIMTTTTMLDAKIRFSKDKAMLYRFCVISIVLFILVYLLSSALILYWIVSNFISMVTYMLFQGCNLHDCCT